MESDQAAPPGREQAPWGFWATIGLSVVVYLVFIGVSMVILFALGGAYWAAKPDADMQAFLEAAATNGFIAFLGISLAAPACIALVLLFVKWKGTLSATDYLGLVPAGARATVVWFASLALLLITVDILSYALGRAIVPDIMAELYRSAHFPPLAWFAVIIAAPAFEEVFFRGFLFRGIQASALGNTGAVLITASAWAVSHAQYDAYGLATVFVLGLLLGAARAITGSLYLTTAMHGVTNLIATIEIYLFAGS